MEELDDGEVVRSENQPRLGDGGGHDRRGGRAVGVAPGRVLHRSLGGGDGTLTPDSQTLATEVDDVVRRLRMPRKPSVEGRHTTSLREGEQA